MESQRLSQRLQSHQVQRHSQLRVASGWGPLTGHTCPQCMGGTRRRPCWQLTRGVTSVSYPDRRREQGPQEVAASSQVADGDMEVAVGCAHVWPLGPMPEKCQSGCPAMAAYRSDPMVTRYQVNRM